MSTLQRIQKTVFSGNIRNQEPIEGFYMDKPQKGRGFVFFGEGLKAGTRRIYTSNVVFIKGNRFTTLSGSVYELID